MIEADKRKAIFLLHQEGMSARQIARRLRVSRPTVRIIIQQEGAMPRIERSDKQRIDPELLREVCEQCDGRVQRMHTKLVEEHGRLIRKGIPALPDGPRSDESGALGLWAWGSM